jgi:BMFP domain-containing protein YqiC
MLAPTPQDPFAMNTARMIDLAQLDELARRLSSLVPPGLRGIPSEETREELQQNFKSVLQAGLGKLDLVTREEFEVQRAVLARTREKLEALERRLADLADGAAAGDSPNPPQH